MLAVNNVVGTIAGHQIPETPPAEDQKDKTLQTELHAVGLLGSRDWRMIAVATVTAVIVARDLDGRNAAAVGL